MKILIADKISDAGIDYLKEQTGFEVVVAVGSAPDRLMELIFDAAAVIVRSETKITVEVIAAAQSLKVIARAGVGVDNVDLEAATERGIVVMNAPSGNTNATAELTITHMLCAARPICQADASMRQGQWDRKQFIGTELFGKTVGILGLGRVGTEVAKRAQSFGMKVIACDPYLAPERGQALDVESVEFEEILKRADFISVHMPLTEKSRGLINAAVIAQMKDGVRIINCARGGIVVEADLVTALKSGKVSAAGLDVYEEEPVAPESELRKLPGLVMTPHLGASTREAQQSVGLEVAKGVAGFLKEGIVVNALNMPSVELGTLKILKPYLELGEKLGRVLQQIVNPSIEKLRITYWGRIIGLETLPLTRSIQTGYLRNIGGENVNAVNAPHYMKRLGIKVIVTQSDSDRDYTELVRVEAVDADKNLSSVEGTLIGLKQSPRIVRINRREVETSMDGNLLILEHVDMPGIIGMVGSVLGRDKVNIASMSLSRNTLGGLALTVLQLDSLPGKKTLDEITSPEAIKKTHLVEL